MWLKACLPRQSSNALDCRPTLNVCAECVCVGAMSKARSLARARRNVNERAELSCGEAPGLDQGGSVADLQSSMDCMRET